MRYLAHELGPKGVRVNGISAAPVPTRAVCGIDHLDELVAEAAAKAPLHRPVSSDEVGRAALMLASPVSSGVRGDVGMWTPADTPDALSEERLRRLVSAPPLAAGLWGGTGA